MMRKDVKLGFAIGGVLLAVVVVYVLVGTGGGEKNPGTAGIVTEDPSGAGTSGAGTAVTSGANSGSRDRSGNATGSVAPLPRDASGTPASPTATNTTTPINPSTDSPKTGESPVASKEQPKRDANGDLWGKALDEGKLMMVSETPTPNAPSAAANTNKPDASAPRTNAGATPPPSSSDNNNADKNIESTNEPKPGGNDRFPLTPITSDGPSTRPSRIDGDAPTGTVDRSRDSRAARADGPNTHTIQKGETLAMISQAAYGSPNFYPHILRANPGLVPEKLKPGMVINLPLASAVKPSTSNDPNRAQLSSSSASSSATAATIDTRTQYRVESGDSLYRIAQKLYGKPEMADKIYEINKDTIGADRAKLKLHAVLKLPEPPTSTASTSAAR